MNSLRRIYLTLVPSLRGASRQIESQISPAAAAAGTTLGDQLKNGIATGLSAQVIGSQFQQVGSTLSTWGGNLSKWITLPAMGAATAVGGIALAGGWGRLTSIENAEASIRSLGHSAEDASNIIQVDVMAAVEGTAFALQDAGQAAAGFLSSGVQPGQELSDVLTLVADAAQISQTDFGHMASMMQRVQGEGKLTGGVLQQMMDNGLYVVPMLAEAFGKTEAEIREMATEGQISAAMFEEAMVGQIGGAAQEAGSTTESAMANMRTAFSNLGATALTEVMPQIKEVIDGLIESFKSPEFKNFATTVGQNLASAFEKLVGAVQGVWTWWQQLSPGWQKFIGIAAGVAVAIGPVLKIVGFLSTGIGTVIKVGGALIPIIKGGVAVFKALNVVLAANPIGAIVTAIGLLVAGLIWFFTETELGQEIWANFTQFLGEAWENIVAFGKAVWEGLSDFFAGLWDGIVGFVTGAVDFIVDLFLNWHPLGIIISNWEPIVGFMKGLWESITTAISVAIDFVKNVITTGVNRVRDTWNNVWNGIKTFFSNIWSGIVGFATSYVNTVRTVITTVVNTVKNTWNNVWNGIKTFFSNIWSAIVGAAKNYLTAVRDNFTRVLDFVKGIPDKILGFFKNMGTWLLNSGKALVDGFLTGIKNAWSRLTGWVSDGLQKIRNLFPFSPAKTGPFSGRGWVLNSGLSIGEAFGAGIASSLHDARGDVHDELAGIQDEFSTFDEQQFFAGFDVPALSSFRPSALSVAAGEGSDRPIYADTGQLIGWIRELANGEARLVVAEGLSAGSRGRLRDELGVR